MEWFETKIRVRYAETDKMGIVHHSNFLIWFEFARSEFCRSRGFSYLEMERDDALMIVAETYCRYKAPAYYEDEIIVRTHISEIRSRSIQFVYELFRASDNTLIAEGETLHVVTDNQQKVKTLPEIYKEKLLSQPIPDPKAVPTDVAPS